MKKVILVMVIGLLLFLLYYFFIRFNFHIVIKDQVYRSAHPSVAQLTKLKKKYKIRSVINLWSM